MTFNILKGLFLSNTSLGLKVSPAGDSLQFDRHPKTPPACRAVLSQRAVSLFNHYSRCASLFIYMLAVSTRPSHQDLCCVPGAGEEGFQVQSGTLVWV